MGKKKWIDKKNASTFTLVYRPQNDPLIHDEESSSMVFKPVRSGNEKTRTASNLENLEDELGSEVTSKIRKNEGEAAMYGIYFDDTEYDYMQHLREIGTSSEAVFVEAPQAQSKQKGKKKLEDAILSKPDPSELLPTELLPSENLVKRTYQDQQDIPDVLAGFQPDMDPRLREVLEALDDDEYVDDDEELFGELTKEGEATLDEFQEQDGSFDDEDDDGWATDDTEKPASKTTSGKPAQPSKADQLPSKSVSFSNTETSSMQPEGSGDWLKEYNKFKKAQMNQKSEDVESSIGDIMSFGGSEYSIGGSRRRRRRKGARTASTGYSMTSSSLFRTEGLTLLDDRFDKIEEEYADSDEDDGDGTPSKPKGNFIETRTDFNSIMDDFLDNYSIGGKNGRIKRSKAQTGLEQLDEIRRELGRARIR
ncbi:Low temperature viability protein [Kalaharituber pfeilii]|nr:Low temperature viability protein [Kalaharituber pfeilii]